MVAAEEPEDVTIMLQQELAVAQKRAIQFETALVVVTVVYIIIYIMGRRRLMRKLWNRNKELKTALGKAEESDRMKTAFIRNMSHEIRTPLNAINGFSRILNSEGESLSSEERTDMVERITRNVEGITKIVDELIDMSEGESSFEIGIVHVNELCRRMIGEVKKNNEKGLFLMLDSELPEDFVIESNEKNIARILRHIFSNALKFTEKGSISMYCEKRDEQVVISISDTGIGIAPEKREEIFKNFVQLNENADGVGLGLTLSRRLARRLGGDVVLDETYTGGSCFQLLLPVRSETA
jgi:signal transduction histidine kinase